MRSRNWESEGISQTPKVEERLLVCNWGWKRRLELEQGGVLDVAQSERAEVTIAEGVADLAQLAGVDDSGYVVGDGGDQGGETK